MKKTVFLIPFSVFAFSAGSAIAAGPSVCGDNNNFAFPVCTTDGTPRCEEVQTPGKLTGRPRCDTVGDKPVCDGGAAPVCQLADDNDNKQVVVDGFTDIHDLAHQVCGLGPMGAAEVWELTKPPLSGPFADPAKDCNDVCPTWVAGCSKAAISAGDCLTRAAAAATKQVEAECKKILDKAERNECLQMAGAELKVIRAEVKIEVNQSKDDCKASQQMCIDDCVTASP